MQSVDLSTEKTRHRLLNAAGQVFAEKGFRGATIREICDRAGANIASVNYYFHDKEELYRLVLDYAHSRVGEHVLHAVRDVSDAAPEEKLRAFVRAHLLSLLGTDGPPNWFSTLVTREMIEPTHLQRDMVENEIRPRFEVLTGIIGEILGPLATAEQLRHCALSVVSQSVFYKLASPVIRVLQPQQSYSSADLEVLADHIAEFSVAGIRNVRSHMERNKG